eukprot:gnl/TRDRNA2_/TRDRNA2_178837_c0_seq1.p1 gnl/TRDRNA2_/TRDRNA2_178837_c0~~gnl/TRDRNA2_/TRDRNA2_178837_c0_seq1.p1  ORF type:complete len:225 (+),score=54.83 gnl/TRDRNA2_/TRDRNA2_178837_c0_seq1:59-733(+)
MAVANFILFGGLFLCWLPAVLAVESASGPSADWALLSHKHRALHLATDTDLNKLQAQLDDALEEAKKEIDAEHTKQMNQVDAQLRESIGKIRAKARTIVDEAHGRMTLLKMQARRAKVSLYHGVYGKCCCLDAGESACEWTSFRALEGRVVQQCPSGTSEYTDHRLPEGVKTKQEGHALDAVLDACAVSEGWSQLTEGSSSLAEAPMPDGLKQLVAIARDLPQQ